MSLSRNELIKAIIKGLKLDENPFAYQTIAESVESLSEDEYMDYYKKVLNEDAYGNGMKAVIRIAKTYQYQKDESKRQLAYKTQSEAMKIESNVVSFASALYIKARQEERSQEDLLEEVLESITTDTRAIMNLVKPYYDFRQLIFNISNYANGEVRSLAFLDAYKSFKSGNAIENNRVNKLIGDLV